MACGVESNENCNDADENEKPGQTWYIDADGDGYSVAMLMTVKPAFTVSLASTVANPGVVVSCSRPDGGKLASELTGYGDCNDNNNTTWQRNVVFEDSDGDGFTTGNGQSLCYGAAVPVGFRATRSAADDCNDGDGHVWQSATLFIDNDGDGFTTGSGEVMCFGATMPQGFIEAASTTNDCDDGNGLVWQSATLYTDGDGDGFTTGDGQLICYGASIPKGYRAQKSEVEDCTDNNASINPGALEVCGNGIDDNCNGKIDEGCITTRLVKVNLFGGVNP